MKPSLSEGELVALLRERYPRDAYALLPQCRNGTGSSADRSADAVVMSLWPSRGLDLMGFECKTYRSDWLKELKSPGKAEPIAKYCDYWWVVIGNSDIAKVEEMPLPWGLLCPTEKGNKLAVLKQPERLTAQPITREFLGSILRKVQQCEEAPTIAAIAKAVDLRLEEMRERMRETAESKLRQVVEDRDALKAAIEQFRKNTGINVHDRRFGWSGDVTSAINFATSGGIEKLRKELVNLQSQALTIAHRIKQTIDADPVDPDWQI